ncbi:probable serine/threonine-protein kinase WNK9 [Chenopodium quinoa]|uniref:non-specific serine/threonine protein kinase n=1 Tax=Chenopodium quinoa TaxID=63459 RepID=A0A803MTB3_CHEQI|nr:probable serine/threonine-protein kinase WNK9 [Chenopodium quinoa]
MSTWSASSSTSSIDTSDTDDYRVMVEQSPRRRYVRYDTTIAKGATETVYKGFDKISGKEIAWCKMTELADDELIQKLHTCSLLKQSLDHQNVIKCYRFFRDRSKPKILNNITESFTSDLKDYINKHTLVHINTAIKIWCRQILNALHYLHNRTIPLIHHDVKIDNIFVIGELGMVKLGYFGHAFPFARVRRTTSFAGMSETTAPDVFEQDYNEKIDIYSLGMTVLQMVTQEKLFSECNGNTEMVCEMIKNGELPAALNNVRDLHIRRFIDKCISPVSERPTAIDLLKDGFLADDDVPERLTAGGSDSIQSLRESVRAQVVRLLQQRPPVESQDTEQEKADFDNEGEAFGSQGGTSETDSETSRSRTASPSRPSTEPETGDPETSTGASKEQEEEDETPLLRRKTTRNVERGGETFGSEGRTSETDSPSRTHETSSDEQDQASYMD